MRAKVGTHYLNRGDCFRTFTIDCEHKRDFHEGQIEVYGNEELRDLIVVLLNRHFKDKPMTRTYNSVPDVEDKR